MKTWCAALALACLALLQGCDRSPPTQGATQSAPVVVSALIWAPDWRDEMQKIADEFGRRNPDVRVEVEFMSGNSVEANIKPRLADGRLPDLVSINPNAFGAMLGEQGLLADVEQTTAWSEMHDSIKGDWITRSGRRFGISGGVATTMIYYNKALFSQASIERLPADFDEFLALCEKLKGAGIVPIVWYGGFPNMLGNGPFGSGFANNVAGADPAWRRKLADGKLNLDTPAAADIFAKMREVPSRGFVQPNHMETGYEEGMRLFTAGKVAMIFHGSWMASRLMHGNGFDTGVFLPPWNARGRAPVPVIGSETGFAVCETPRKAAALRFLEFMAGPGYAILQNKRHNIPPFKRPQGRMVIDPQIEDYMLAATTLPVAVSPYYSFLPSGAIERLHPLMQDVLAGKTTPRQAARILDAEVRAAAKPATR